MTTKITSVPSRYRGRWASPSGWTCAPGRPPCVFCFSRPALAMSCAVPRFTAGQRPQIFSTCVPCSAAYGSRAPAETAGLFQKPRYRRPWRSRRLAARSLESTTGPPGRRTGQGTGHHAGEPELNRLFAQLRELLGLTQRSTGWCRGVGRRYWVIVSRSRRPPASPASPR